LLFGENALEEFASAPLDFSPARLRAGLAAIGLKQAELLQRALTVGGSIALFVGFLTDWIVGWLLGQSDPAEVFRGLGDTEQQLVFGLREGLLSTAF
jgi:hypothetical protein